MSTATRCAMESKLYDAVVELLQHQQFNNCEACRCLWSNAAATPGY